MRDTLRLFLNGQPLEVRGDDAFLTLSDFLRKRQRLTGTKVVCAEGDCGSCSVLVGRPHDDSIRYRAITSCIVSMHQLDATHVITIEGLKDGDALNPIQKAMVACHGAQCGFCTPGFVVALTQVFEEDRNASREHVCRGLVGNLCRCTGYDAILAAAESTPRDQLIPLSQRYPESELVASISAWQRDEVEIELSGKRFYKPPTLQHAIAFRSAQPGCTVINGATDWGVLLNKRVKEHDTALVISGLADEQSVTLDASHHSLRIGACTTLADLEVAANEHLPALGDFLEYFGSPLIKHGGTLAGNVATGSPIGDSLPMLHVMNAEIELASVRGMRRVNINSFYTGYRANVMTPDELISAIRLPLLKPNERLKLYKISRRKDLDIATFGAAFWLRLKGDVIDDIRIAYGGVAATIVRMTQIENHLRGKVNSEALFAEAASLAWRDLKPLTDVRGSATYRLTLAANILRKVYAELSDTGCSDPIPQIAQ